MSIDSEIEKLDVSVPVFVTGPRTGVFPKCRDKPHGDSFATLFSFTHPRKGESLLD